MSDLRDHTKPCEHGFVRPHWEPDDPDLWPEDIDYDEISPTELCPGGERVGPMFLQIRQPEKVVPGE